MFDFMPPLNQSWYFFKANIVTISRLLLPFIIPLSLLSVFSTSLASNNDDMGYLPALATALQGLFYPIYQGALISYIADTANNQQHTPQQYYRLAMRYWRPLFLVYVISSIAMLSGFMLFILPGFFILARLAYAEFYCLFNQSPPLQAITCSWRQTQHKQWLLFKGIVCIFLTIVIPLWLMETVVDSDDSSALVLAFFSELYTAIMSSFMTIFCYRIFSQSSR